MIYSSRLNLGHVTLKTRSLGQIEANQFSALFSAGFGPINLKHGQHVHLIDLQFKFEHRSRDLEN